MQKVTHSPPPPPNAINLAHFTENNEICESKFKLQLCSYGQFGYGQYDKEQILLKNVAIRWQSSLKVQKLLYLPLAPLFVERPTCMLMLMTTIVHFW